MFFARENIFLRYIGRKNKKKTFTAFFFIRMEEKKKYLDNIKKAIFKRSIKNYTENFI